MPAEGLPLSPSQSRLLSAEDPLPGLRSVAWIEVRGALDTDVLRDALARLVDKFEILRTTFEGGEQQIHDQGDFSLHREERSAAPARTLSVAQEQFAVTTQDRGLAARVVSLEPERHWLFVSWPAATGDARSLQVFAEELAASYAAGMGDAGFDDEAMQYADIAEWQREFLESEDARPAIRFWRGLNLAPQAEMELPLEQTPAGGEFRILRQSVDLAGDRMTQLLDRAGGEARLESFLFAAWTGFLRRLVRVPELVVGLVRDGRSHEELEEALGVLARTLPVCVNVSDVETVPQLRARMDQLVKQLDQWQDGFQADQFEPPHHVFEYRRAPSQHAGGPLSFQVLDEQDCLGRFRSRWTLRRTRDGLTLTLDHDPTVVDAETATRMTGQFRSFLAGLLEDPDRPIARLPMLAEDEARRLLVDFNRTDADYPRGQVMHEQIEAHAATHPDRVAVEYGDEQLTYGELDARANRLAHHLRSLGVGPDQLVGLCVERSPELVVGILGILKAGGAYVPLDPNYPSDRLAFLVEDIEARVVVTQEKLVGLLDADAARLVVLDRDREVIDACPSTRPDSGVAPGNLVYVIYTSGSTGKPKGVVITHDKLMISNTAREHAFDETPDRFLLLSSFAFDSSVVGLFWTLCGGGTLLLVPEGVQQNVQDLPALIERHQVSHLLTLPSFYGLILGHAAAGQMDCLKTSIVAGEACPLKMVDRHRELLPGTRLFSEYGATETTVFASVYDCLQQTLPIAPVGGPIENARMYVLDANLEPCPIGMPGEVHFGGPAIADGYLNRPALTAERYVPDPFDPAPGMRLYKSGDLARHLPCGDVEFLGRIDNQVKIRGYRIELEEIEVRLTTHPSVEEAVVLARADISEEKRLLGYVVCRDPQPSVSDLREHIKQELPEFMVPAVFVFLDDMPRTPNGKVDRKSLPEPGSERPDLADSFVAPRTDVEHALASIWSQVLNLEQVGVHDNFFELGGDSILSIQIIARAKQAGLGLTPRQVFEFQTIAELAEAAAAATPQAVPVAEQGAVEGPAPLTPVQHWFFELGLPDPSWWNMPVLLAPGRRLSVEAVDAATRVLHEHHDALRLRFEERDGAWHQEFLPGGDPPSVLHVDLTGADPTEVSAALERAATDAQQGLDLGAGPLWRLVLFDLPAGQQRLMILVHHLAVDGVSQRILVEDLAAALAPVESGRELRLPAKTTSYRDWARGLQELAGSDELAAELEHWKPLAGTAPAALPLDHPDGDNREGSVERVTVTLNEEETRALLNEVPRAYGTRINDVLLAAFVEAVGEWTGQTELLVNLEGHGREDLIDGIDLSRTVGWFTTDYPVRLATTRPFAPGAALVSMKEQLRTVPRQGVGFGILRHLSPDPEVRALCASLPRPTLAFNYLGQFDQVYRDGQDFQPAHEPVGPTQAPAGPRPFVLEAYGGIADGRLSMEWEFSHSLHDRSTIEGVAGRFVDSLRQLIDHCLAPDAGALTTSDFSDFDWDAVDLQNIGDAIRRTQEGA